MNSLHIGSTIAKCRKGKGVTQEELAAYLGVSKPAVSKWESGQSYPDILLLPVLAAYFDISVDDLLGYEPQMSRENIKKLYLRLADGFSKQPFDEIYAQVKDYVRDYYSCWELLFSMAQLLLNHAPLSGPTRMNSVIGEASGLFIRVEQQSGDPVLARQALSLRAYCCLALGRPIEAIDLLDGIEESPISTEMLLAKAHAMKGDTAKAQSLLQISLYKNLLTLFSAISELMASYADAPEKVDACLQKALDLGRVFSLKKMYPTLYFTLYLTAASLFTAQKRNDRALDVLEEYVELLSREDVFPIKLKGNEFFDLIAPYFETLNLGTSAPRSDSLILKDIRDGVISNPAFLGLAGEPRFEKLSRRLSHIEVKA